MHTSPSIRQSIQHQARAANKPLDAVLYNKLLVLVQKGAGSYVAFKGSPWLIEGLQRLFLSATKTKGQIPSLALAARLSPRQPKG